MYEHAAIHDIINCTMAHGTLLLAGSGEFTDAMIKVDRYLFRDIKNPAIAIIPTAAGQETDWLKWVEYGKIHFKKLGMHAYGVSLRKKSDASKPSVIADIAKANAFYFSGGDPAYVLSVMKKSPAWNTVYRKFQEGAVLAGSSAGAMFMGSWIPSNIRGVLEDGTKEPQWEKALGLVPYMIWPHYDWGRRTFGDKITRLIEAGQKKSSWLGIDEDTAVIWESGKKPRVMGSGTAHWNVE